uniref:uncharacterized protein LOC124054362 isoform X2 n=1 Tax=Scatophagus argus TaxID=75038 RepID=UPI001ED80BCD|nr:uncharacterized protein LOC124054362 isoform X2 [Scatophagus argus]
MGRALLSVVLVLFLLNTLLHFEHTEGHTRPVLTVSPSWLSPGALVTLNCSAKDLSTGWRFYWYEAVPQVSGSLYGFKMLPGSSGGTEDSSFTIHGQTYTAGYVCKAERVTPKNYTYYSKPKFVWSGDFRSAAARVRPDRVQHFPSESVSVRCEGSSSEWRLMRLSAAGHLSNYTNWGEMDKSTFSIHKHTNNTAVYWCETGSGQFSNAVNITVQKKDIILTSPVHPVTEGDLVTLGCKPEAGNFTSRVLFYRNDELIQNDTRGEMGISAVSGSDEGFYRCESSGNVSPLSWVAVKLSRQESSSYHLPLTVGMVCCSLLVILLLLFCCCRKSKYLCFARAPQSQRTDQTEQEESQPKVPSSPDGSHHVTYAVIQLQNLRNKGKSVADETVYSEVKVGAALGP